MSVSWKQNYSPDDLINKIEESKSIDSKGKEKFTGFDFKEYLALLFSMLNFHLDISEYDARQITRRAVFNVGKKGEITSKKFIKEINKLESKILKKPFNSDALSTSISIKLNN